MTIFIGSFNRRTFQIFKQSDTQSGVYPDTASRDSYFTANPEELARLDSNEFLIIKLLDNGSGETAYQQRLNNAWVDVTSLVQGEDGPAGPTGNSYFFASPTSRDTFFNTGTNRGLLETDLPVTVNNGSKISSTYVWSGETSPAIYDPDDWRVSAIETSSGTLFLGESGARINSGNEVLGFIAPDNDKHYVHGIEYFVEGNAKPRYWKLGSLKTTVLADVSTATLSAPQDLSLSLPVDAMIVKFSVIPATAGKLRIRSWAATSTNGPLVLDEDYDILAGDVGNVTEFVLPNDFLAEAGRPIFIRLSGVDLKGGLQILPTFSGQTVPYIAQAAHVAVAKEYQEGIDDFVRLNQTYNQVGTSSGGLVVAYEGTSTIANISGAFTSGVNGVSNPTVLTQESDVFQPQDIVSFVADPDTPDENQGFYEVISHTGQVLTIAGIGLTGVTHEGILKDQFIDQIGTGVIRKVGISGVSVTSNGELERFKGSSTPLAFDEINVGIIPKKFAYFYDESNATPTTITTSAQYEDINCVLTGDMLEGFTVSGNVLTYTASKPINAKIMWDSTIDVGTDTVLIKAFKNGTIPLNGRGVGGVDPFITGDAEIPIQATHVVSLVQGDTVHLKLANATDTSDLTALTITGLIEEIT